MTPPWWHNAVIYQVYLRSFADANGDGVGDLAGLRSRLDYLTDLGVDGLCLSPCYPSPHRDYGYDIADYTGIDPDYGDLEEFGGLLADAHARGLKVLMDLVPNHCSSTHPWFRAALAAGPGSPERQRFFFRDGRGAGGMLPPNNWRSAFGGPAWTRVSDNGRPGQWYLHLFDAGQPDFNWRHPDVPEMFEEVLRLWFERGIDGFRIVVAHGLFKHPTLPDWNGDFYNDHAWDQPDVHEVYRQWRRIAAEYLPERDLTFVGDVQSPVVVGLADYLRRDELPQAFWSELLEQPWHAPSFRQSIDKARQCVGTPDAAIAWTLANHDVHRAVTRFGMVRNLGYHASIDPSTGLVRPRGPVDVTLGERRGRAAALLLLALPGSQYLYQGEELGLPEVLDMPDSARQDPVWVRSGGLDPGRDGCRVPLPWSTQSRNYGFSLGEMVFEPWLPQPEWFAKYAVSDQLQDGSSTLTLYREALRARRGTFAPGDGELVWIEVPGRDDVLVFRRGDAVCVVVFGDAPFELPREWGEIELTSVPMARERWLLGSAAAWLRCPRSGVAASPGDNRAGTVR